MNTPLFPRLPGSYLRLLNKLERQRKLVARKWIAWLLLLPVSVFTGWVLSLFFGLFDHHDNGLRFVGGIIGFLCLVGGAMWISLWFPDPEDMDDEYRKTILPLLVKEALPGWSSESEHRLGLTDIVSTRLFRDSANQVIKEDYFTGPAGNSTAKIYEVNIRRQALRKVRVPKGGSFYETDITNRFYGYFYFLSPMPHFSSRCWIFPRKRKARGETDDWAFISSEVMAREAAEVSVSHAAFNEVFVVFAEDTAAAQQLLNSTRCDLLLRAAQQLPAACAFSFYHSHLYAMNGFPEDPHTIFKGKTILSDLEADHRNELVKMKAFVDLLGKL